MLKLEYNQLESLAHYQLCAEHETPVVLVWHKDENCWTLRCGEGHYPDALMRNLTATELWRAGAPMHPAIEENIKKREVKKAMTQDKKTQDPRFALVPKADLGSGELLVPEQIKALVEYAQGYGLDPYRGHVVLMYGKPYIGLDGYLFHANRSGQPYKLTSRPLNDKERGYCQISEGDHAWLAEVTMAGGNIYFSGLGIVTQEEITAESQGKPGQKRYPVVAAHPQLLAQKRAEWQALRRAFPIGETEEKKED